MKNFFLCFICIFLNFCDVNSQELLIYNQYLDNHFLLNPAVAGSDKCIKLKLSDRHQWLNIENTPNTQVISVHGQLTKKEHPLKKHGLGMYLFNDENGANKQKALNLSYAFHLTIDKHNQEKTQLAFGVSLSNHYYSLDSRNLVTAEMNDPTIKKTIESAFLSNICLGTYLYGSKYFIGLSATYLVPNSIALYDKNLEPDFKRHFFLHAGLDIKEADKNLIISPSFVIKLTQDKKLQNDYNIKLKYNNAFIIASYRANYDKFNTRNLNAVLLAGFDFRNMNFTYAYDIPLNEMYGDYMPSHQISIGYNICRNFKYR